VRWDACAWLTIRRWCGYAWITAPSTSFAAGVNGMSWPSHIVSVSVLTLAILRK
jgi:hypothetical protein